MATVDRGFARGYRQLIRQRDVALAVGDPLAADPQQLPRRWTAVSLLVALALLAGTAALAVIRPAGQWAQSSLLLVRDNGALLLNQDGVLHQVPNYTSAVLALGSPTGVRPTPALVSATDIAGAPLGAPIGIAGAPESLPNPIDNPIWTVCGDSDEVRIGPEAAAAGAVAAGGATQPTEAALVVPITDKAASYLLWNGWKARIDLGDAGLVAALGLTSATPAVVADALVDALPESAPIGVPTMPDAGTGTVGFAVTALDQDAPLRVGALFVVHRAAGVEYFVMAGDGYLPVSATLADILWFHGSGAGEIPVVEPAVLAATPRSLLPSLEPRGLPPAAPRLVAGGAAQLCAQWGRAGWTLLSGSLATGAPRASTTGGGAVVLATARPAEPAANGQVTALLFLVIDGVAYPVSDGATLARLGYPLPATLSPVALVDLLPRGPILTLGQANS